MLLYVGILMAITADIHAPALPGGKNLATNHRVLLHRLSSTLIFFFTGSIEIILLSLLDYFLKRALLDDFVSLTFRRLNSLLIAVAMDSKPRRLKRNVVIKFRN